MVSKNYPKQGITWSVIPSSVYIGGVGGGGGARVAPKQRQGSVTNTLPCNVQPSPFWWGLLLVI